MNRTTIGAVIVTACVVAFVFYTFNVFEIKENISIQETKIQNLENVVSQIVNLINQSQSRQ